MEEIKFWGICPNDQSPRCPNSYKKAEGLRDWLSGWVTNNCMPDSGWPGKAELPLSYQDIFQPFLVEDGFCQKCGTHLAFKASFPSLGLCDCQREYSEADLMADFCPTCGKPVDISGELRAQIAKQKQLASLFDDVLPLLKKRGFIATLMG